MEEKHPLNRTKEVSVDVVPSVDANNFALFIKIKHSSEFCKNFYAQIQKQKKKKGEYEIYIRRQQSKEAKCDGNKENQNVLF